MKKFIGRLKEFSIQLLISTIYIIVVHIMSNNHAFNDFVAAIVVDIIIVELWFNPVINKTKIIIEKICIKINKDFNEHLYDNFYSIQINEIRFFILSLCIFLPSLSQKLKKTFPLLVNQTNSQILNKIVKFENSLLYEIISLLIIVIIWAFLIILLRNKISKYYKIHNIRSNDIKNNHKYSNIDLSYSIFIDNYTDDEIKMLNNNKPLINDISENNDSENTENVSEENSENPTEETETNSTVPEEE